MGGRGGPQQIDMTRLEMEGRGIERKVSFNGSVLERDGNVFAYFAVAPIAQAPFCSLRMISKRDTEKDGAHASRKPCKAFISN